MGWTYIAANNGMGLEAQYVRRIGPAPAIALKRAEDDRWVAWVLDISGISARAVYFAETLTIVEAKAAAENAAKDAGWKGV